MNYGFYKQLPGYFIESVAITTFSSKLVLLAANNGVKSKLAGAKEDKLVVSTFSVGDFIWNGSRDDLESFLNGL